MARNDFAINPSDTRVVPGFVKKAHYYDRQFKNGLFQFMAIFTGLQVTVGERNEREGSLIPVPIHYGHPDNVVAAIKAGNNLNKPVRLPMMSANIRGIRQAPELYTGVGQLQRQTITPYGGLLPNDTKVVTNIPAIPYIMETELWIYTSNTEHQFELLEQIFMAFDREMQIQISDTITDRQKITSVKLTDIRYDNNFPIGEERRENISVLTFEVTVYLATPISVRDDFIRRIKLRVGAVATGSNLPEEMIADLDAQGIPYKEIVNLDDLPSV